LPPPFVIKGIYYCEITLLLKYILEKKENYSENTEKYLKNGIFFHFMHIDDKDKRILEVLRQNSKLTTQKIAKKLNIPITTIHNRIKKLEKEGIIQQYTIALNHQKLGKGILAVILISVNYLLPGGKKIQQEDIAKSIKKLGAETVYIVTGGTDILITLRTKDVEELNDFIIKKLRNVDGVDKTQTMLVLHSI